MTKSSLALRSHDRGASFFFLWIGPGSLTGRPLCAGCRRPLPFSQQRTTQNEYRPQKLDRRHGLLQEQRGKEQCRNRFHIAQKRHGMCGDVLHSGKIQEIGKAGVDRAQNKKCRDLMFLRDRQPRGEKDIKKNDHKGHIQFDGGRLQSAGTADVFIEHDQCRV